MIFNMVGGGSGGLKATDAILRVIAPAESTVTITKNGVSKSDAGHENAIDPTLFDYYFIIHSSQFDSVNPWTVTATLGSESSSDTIVIDSADEYDVELSYSYWIFKSGVGEVVPLTTKKQINGSISIGTTEITVSYSSTTNGGVCCYNTTTIDASGYATLHVIATITDSFSTANWRGMAFAATSAPSADDSNADAKYVAKTNMTLNGQETDSTVDLTSLSSSQLASLYVGYKGVNKGTITNIYLTR